MGAYLFIINSLNFYVGTPVVGERISSHWSVNYY